MVHNYDLGTKAMSFPRITSEDRAQDGPRVSLPYAQAWDRFTKLQDSINTDIRLLASIPFGGGIVLFLLLYVVTPRRYEEYDILIALGAVVAGFIYLYVASFEWLFWRCPRCHNRWPGWSKKEPCCAVCGLRLFQDAP